MIKLLFLGHYQHTKRNTLYFPHTHTHTQNISLNTQPTNKNFPVGMRALGPGMCLQCHFYSEDAKLGFPRMAKAPLYCKLDVLTGFSNYIL